MTFHQVRKHRLYCGWDCGDDLAFLRETIKLHRRHHSSDSLVVNRGGRIQVVIKLSGDAFCTIAAAFVGEDGFDLSSQDCVTD